ncbi:hypothetical protein NUW58_g4202 [Xylaria curta]|uniref:Uncharacterized protein n=1 Tax=Xylaria curta TaxID=42375 RepID=A0ACC1P7W0_9PEZI|nr:hypothetical protein NUW58_g4202 [Xylaria curta]
MQAIRESEWTHPGGQPAWFYLQDTSPLISSDEPSIFETPVSASSPDAFPEEPPIAQSSVDSSATISTQAVSASGPLSLPLSDGSPLRVMFLGASVTRGAVSVGNLEYRSPLRDRLAALENPVNFVISQRVGAFKDSDTEAYPGNRIDQAHEHATRIVPSRRPNI